MKEEITFTDIWKKVISIVVGAVSLLIAIMTSRRGLIALSYQIAFTGIAIAIFLVIFSINFSMLPKSNEKNNVLYQVCDFFSMLLIVWACFQIVYSNIYFKSVVEGESMSPNYHNGDILIVKRTTEVKRFEVVVVEIDEEKNTTLLNLEDGEFLVKRIIGLPGDYFYYYNEILYLNNEIVDEQYLKDENGEFTYYGTMRDFTFYSNAKYNKGEDVCTEINECQVPDDYYFVMGDNRTNSSDSRVFGLFHKSQLVGVVKYRFNSLFDWEKMN